MLKRRLKLWLGLVVSLMASGYFAVSIFFYAWLEASQQWSTKKAALWVAGSVFLTILFIYTFFRCLVGLLRAANNKLTREQQQLDMRSRS